MSKDKKDSNKVEKKEHSINFYVYSLFFLVLFLACLVFAVVSVSIVKNSKGAADDQAETIATYQFLRAKTLDAESIRHCIDIMRYATDREDINNAYVKAKGVISQNLMNISNKWNNDVFVLLNDKLDKYYNSVDDLTLLSEQLFNKLHLIYMETLNVYTRNNMTPNLEEFSFIQQSMINQILDPQKQNSFIDNLTVLLNNLHKNIQASGKLEALADYENLLSRREEFISFLDRSHNIAVISTNEYDSIVTLLEDSIESISSQVTKEQSDNLAKIWTRVHNDWLFAAILFVLSCLFLFLILILVKVFIFSKFINISKELKRYKETKVFVRTEPGRIREVNDIYRFILPAIKKELDLERVSSKVNGGDISLEAKQARATLDSMANRNSLITMLFRMNQFPEKSACIVFDVDNLYSVIADLGIENANIVVLKIVSHIKSTLSKQDLFYKIGGDEFVILKANCTIAQAYRFTWNLLSEIRKLDINVDQNLFKFTISAGVITRNKFNNGDALTMYNESLYALELAKRLGKDRVCTYVKARNLKGEIIIDDDNKVIVREVSENAKSSK